jgi:hypothetical protein
LFTQALEQNNSQAGVIWIPNCLGSASFSKFANFFPPLSQPRAFQESWGFVLEFLTKKRPLLAKRPGNSQKRDQTENRFLFFKNLRRR